MTTHPFDQVFADLFAPVRVEAKSERFEPAQPKDQQQQRICPKCRRRADDAEAHRCKEWRAR